MSPHASILVLDDDRISRETTARQLRAAGWRADAVAEPYSALGRLAEGGWDIVLSDVRMPGMDGLAFLANVRKTHESVDVILMTAYGTVELAVAAMKEGAADFLTKPFSFDELSVRLAKLTDLRQAREELTDLRQLVGDESSQFGIIGRCPGIGQVIERIRIFAGSSAPVLITGETGTGKELVAHALHRAGPRAKKPFVAVACGAVPKELAESELFGHERGAFTGAVRARDGTFVRSDGGTLLLDDVDDLAPDIQAKLLRVLQEGTLTKVGGAREVEVDVRIVATTKTSLHEAAAKGRFRDDLLYRLCGLEVHVPPLRERGDDVILIAHELLARAARAEGAVGKALAPETADALRRYRWPGNVRELRRALESAAVLCRGEEIRPEHLPDFVQGADDAAGGGGLFDLHLDRRERVEFNDAVHAFEQALVAWALRRAGGQQTLAAELLGLPRTTLQSKLNHKNGA